MDNSVWKSKLKIYLLKVRENKKYPCYIISQQGYFYEKVKFSLSNDYLLYVVAFSSSAIKGRWYELKELILESFKEIIPLYSKFPLIL